MVQLGMDRKIEKKKWSKTKLLYVGGVFLFLVLAFYGFKSINKKTYKIDRSKISTKRVEEGEFQNVILIDGAVEPIDLVLVNTIEGGTVDKIFVEDGIRIDEGAPLLKLSNPSVTLTYMNQETAIIEQINNLRNLKLSLEKDQRSLIESLIDGENSLANERRAFKVDSALFQEKVIAKNEYQDRLASYKYLKKKRDFIESNVKRSSEDNQVQIAQINTSIGLMTRNLELIHENVDKMLVRAPVGGMLSSFDPVIGESYSSNQTVAKIDAQSGFKIIGQVDEYYLSEVRKGQMARFYFDENLVDLEVKKVLPEVVNGRFEVELVFTDDIPSDIAIGQSLQVKLELSEATKSILIPRGSYFQASGGRFVFVLDDEGRAHKRQIKLGNNNPTYYQVLDGLSAGEEFITSSYDAFKEYETIKIK